MTTLTASRPTAPRRADAVAPPARADDAPVRTCGPPTPLRPRRAERPGCAAARPVAWCARRRHGDRRVRDRHGCRRGLRAACCSLILRSDEVRGLLAGIIRGALAT